MLLSCPPTKHPLRCVLFLPAKSSVGSCYPHLVSRWVDKWKPYRVRTAFVRVANKLQKVAL